MNNQTTQDIAELRQLRMEMRRWRVATAITSFVIITTGLVILKVSATNLFQPGAKHDAFISELRTDLTQQVVPHVKERGLETFRELKPIVQKELLKMQARAPEIAELVANELNLMNDQLPVRAQVIIEDSIGKTIRERAARLQQQYPEFAENDGLILADAMLEESHQRALKVSRIVIDPYMDAMHKITRDLSAIRETEVNNFPPEATALDLAVALIDVMRAEIDASAPNDPSWTLLSTILAQAK